VKPRFTPRQSFVLYALILGAVFVFYFFGLIIGKSQFSLGQAQARVTAPTPREPMRDVKPDLDFYQRIMAPSGSESEAASKSAPTVEIRSDERETPLLSQPPPASAPVELLPLEPTPVQTAAAEPPSPESSRAAQETSPEVYTVQVAALVSVADARAVLTRLQARGFSGIVQPPLTRDDKFHRVWVGEFDTMDQARQMESRLKARGFQTYVRKTAPAR
jgi:cell division septation protein DedD